MDERNTRGEKLDEIMLPGFRFHPTDEELIGFYLKRKIQQRPLQIELIKQLDIYKYDPWDLPRLATTGEKEWYFYCPRDRKYRNSSRPNRVTGAGFWKATGTDRPIYSSEGSKCIGLKKSLVFYRGRAAKGVKTDWMMHEFRLPSLSDHHSATSNRSFTDNSIIPANDLWAICRIFKKSSSATQRAVSQSWVSGLPTLNDASDMLPNSFHGPFSSNSIPFSSVTNVFPLDYDLLTQIENIKTSHLLPFLNEPISNSLFLSAMADASSEPPKPVGDVTSMLLNMSSSVLGNYGAKSSMAERISTDGSVQEQRNTFLPALLQEKEFRVDNEEGEANGLLKYQNDGGYPLSFPTNVGEAWKTNMFWDCSSSSSDVSPTLSSITRCYN